MALGSLWLFVGTTLAISSYPFEPLNVLGGIFLGAFVIQRTITVLVYSQMSRDSTLSHVTNTSPGKLGLEFWERVVAFGIGPLIGLLTTLFPSITDFVCFLLASAWSTGIEVNRVRCRNPSRRQDILVHQPAEAITPLDATIKRACQCTSYCPRTGSRCQFLRRQVWRALA
jgi:hypothetical protein